MSDPGTYLRHPSSFEHDTGGHPENAGRLRAIEAALEQRDWLGLDVAEAPAATLDQLLRVHPLAHIEAIEELSARGGGMIDMDTVASAGSYVAALHSAGAAVAAVDAVMGGGAPFAFCATRPPGHHAEPSQAMGFCLFNNIAIAAAHALAEHGAGRVAVIDWDVHHGNGTEAIFYETDRVLYSSMDRQLPAAGRIGPRGVHRRPRLADPPRGPPRRARPGRDLGRLRRPRRRPAGRLRAGDRGLPGDDGAGA